jgi:type III pantothenate kinase
MTQDWLFDFGNTRLKCAPLGADGSVGPVRAFALSELDALPSGEVAYLASVAERRRARAIARCLVARFRRIAIARTAATFGGLRIAYANPQKLGVDRFLAMAGAHDAWPR